MALPADNEHRASEQLSFLGALLYYQSTMVKSQSCKIQLFNQLNIIYAVTYR